MENLIINYEEYQLVDNWLNDPCYDLEGLAMENGKIINQNQYDRFLKFRAMAEATGGCEITRIQFLYSLLQRIEKLEGALREHNIKIN